MSDAETLALLAQASTMLYDYGHETDLVETGREAIDLARRIDGYLGTAAVPGAQRSTDTGGAMTDTPWTPGPWDYESVAAVLAGVLDPLRDNAAERNANARLIAAAPEMAEMLMELVSDIPDNPSRSTVDSTYTVRDVYALLARIRGEETPPNTETAP